MKLLCTWNLSDAQKEKLREISAGQIEVVFVKENEVTENDVKDAMIIWGNVSASFVKSSTTLKWLQTGTAGVDAYIVPGVFPKGALFTNATGAYGKSVAEKSSSLS